METIQKEDEGEKFMNEDIQSEENASSRTFLPQKLVSRVSNIESMTSSPLAKSAPEQVEVARKKNGEYCSSIFCA